MIRIMYCYNKHVYMFKKLQKAVYVTHIRILYKKNCFNDQSVIIDLKRGLFCLLVRV